VDPSRIETEFPAPSYRGAQEGTLAEIRAAFEAGNDAVLVRAPTGSGKSLLARAIAGAARRPSEGPPGSPVGAYYTTPQVSQLDDVASDPLLDDLAIVRGKSNYACILPGRRPRPSTVRRVPASGGSTVRSGSGAPTSPTATSRHSAPSPR
jgi:Rad3-related DNA helicase